MLLDAQRGDRAALEAFVRQTQAEIWRFNARLIGSADADDATQETYVALWRALPGYRGDASARTWLFAIARRTALRVGERRDRWHELTRSAQPATAAADASRGVELSDLVAGLDMDRRSALVLTQILGFSYSEAAAICGCPVGTIRSRVARARLDLIADREASAAEAG